MTADRLSADRRVAGHDWRQLPHCTTCGVRLRYVAGAWRHVRLAAPGRRVGRGSSGPVPVPVGSHEPVYVRS